MEGLTRALSIPTPRWFSLRFPDRDLEAAFRQRFAAETVARLRFLLILVALIWCAFGLLDHTVVTGDLLVRTRIMRFGAVLPVLVAVLLLTYAPAPVFERYWQAGITVGFVAIAGGMMFYQLILDLEFLAIGTAGIALVIVGGYTLVMLRFVYALVAALTITLALAGLHVLREGIAGITTSMVVNGMVWVCLANVIGIFACRELELFRRTKFVQAVQLEQEQRRSEALLHNTLPRNIVDRLKRGETSIVDSFDEVTVLFGDLVDFTRLGAKLPPRDLVGLLNELYSEFDQLAERHGLEKIKTVGDAYMVVGGAPLPREDHAEAVAAMALDMLATVRRMRRTWPDVAIRIGIHTGSAVGGVIGTRKLTYDVWGDTVNIASRLQEHGVANAIHVSTRTRALLSRCFDFKSRGVVTLKGAGEVPTYTLVLPGERDA